MVLYFIRHVKRFDINNCNNLLNKSGVCYFFTGEVALPLDGDGEIVLRRNGDVDLSRTDVII